LYKLLLTLLVAVFTLSQCSKNSTGPSKDKPTVPSGTVQFTVSQSGSKLGELNYEVGKHDISFKNAVHIDSIPIGALGFSLRQNNPADGFHGTDSSVFVFIQSIDPNINYFDYLIVVPNSYPYVAKSYFNDIKDSSFYVECYCCLLDTDSLNTGSWALYITNLRTSPTIRTVDSVVLDASKNTVVLDKAMSLKNITVSDSEFMEYSFSGDKINNGPYNIFTLTKYKNYGYEYVHSGLFWDTGVLYPNEKDISVIYAFGPVFPTKYQNKLGLANYFHK
jgi:hypothetical protein